ncbi:unnamed protein product [Lactuca saligna]|uniref:Uncharacterized protein n=1 Tax=Lactuca saligna TaxID=75948 RepID=A0AA35ZLJ4_LACSI|nr:unnamed protein product [Lactuca saligna]
MKANVVTSESIEVTNKSKKPVPKPRSPSPVLQDESAKRTISQPQNSIPLSTPIFIYSTVPTTTSVTTLPEVPIIKSVSEEIRTSGIPGNTSDVEPNANIGVSSEPSSFVPPTLHEDVVEKDDQMLHPGDVEITYVLKRKPTLTSAEQPQNIEKMKGGSINKEHWSIVYKRKEGEVIKNRMLFLRNKHVYSTNALKTILSSAESNNPILLSMSNVFLI